MSNFTTKLVVSKMHAKNEDGAAPANSHQEMSFHMLDKGEASQVEEALIHTLVDMKQIAKNIPEGFTADGPKYTLHAHFTIHKSGTLFTGTTIEWPNVSDEMTDALMGAVKKNMQGLTFIDKLQTK